MKAGIAYIRKELEGLYSKEELDSFIYLIFEHIKGYDRTRFLLSREEKLKHSEREEISKIVERLKQHEPFQYVLGETEFYGLPFYCNPGVLIPRPETEELVQWILQQQTGNANSILDIGTGTGCIAVALKKNLPEANVFACDISSECLDLASKNAERNKVKVDFFNCNIFSFDAKFSPQKYDVIVSNPPYVTRKEMALMDQNVLNYEPELALFVGDDDPLIFYETITELSLELLTEKGTLYFEINEAFGNECKELLISKGFQKVELRNDINGKARMIMGCIN